MKIVILLVKIGLKSLVILILEKFVDFNFIVVEKVSGLLNKVIY